MKREEKNYIYKIGRPLVAVLLKIIYGPKVYGIENIPEDGALIFAGNHKHAFDPVVVICQTKRIIHYMAKEEIFRGLHGKFFKKIGLIKVDRNKNNPKAVNEAERILKDCGTVGIFPEGTRNRTDKELLKFRTGTVRIAKDTKTKIIPFAIKGEYKIFRRNLSIEFGKPIDVSEMETQEANEYLKNEVLQLLRKNNK